VCLSGLEEERRIPVACSYKFKLLAALATSDLSQSGTPFTLLLANNIVLLLAEPTMTTHHSSERHHLLHIILELKLIADAALIDKILSL